MKLLFENWRKYVKEDVVDIASRRLPQSNEKTFTLDADQLKALNDAIAEVVRTAKDELDAEGEIPYFDPNFLEKIELAEPLTHKMVAEQTDEETDEELGLTPYQISQTGPERMALRRQYHGPEGELKKYGPRAVRGLEKGLGQMSAEEFEETGYVIKISKSVIDDFKQLVESIKETEGLYEEARDWYHNIRGLLDKETESDRDSALLGLLIATYSPRAKFALNLAEALYMYKAVRQDAQENPEDLKQYLETFPGAEKKKPGELRGFTKAHKVPNFALNVLAPSLAGERDEFGDVIYNDFYKWNSTIDTWMIDAFYPSLRKASTAKEWSSIKTKLMSNVVSYRYMARVVEEVAATLEPKILPQELQALIWVASQIKQTGETGLGVTTQFAFNQIREAITNIAEINQDLETFKLLEEKDWLGTIISTINKSGFESAAPFVLGIKDEKGEITTQGVRSLTSSGKKGDTYDYFAPKTKPKPKKKKPKKKIQEGQSSQVAIKTMRKRCKKKRKTSQHDNCCPGQDPARQVSIFKKGSRGLRVHHAGCVWLCRNDDHCLESEICDDGECKKPFQDPKFNHLKTFYVMNNVVQMPTGKFNNLYDSVMLYLDLEFSTDKAIKYILGRFDPEAKASKDYFRKTLKENKSKLKIKIILSKTT